MEEIKLYLRGGLGNQLFQIAAAAYFSFHLSKRLQLSTEHLLGLTPHSLDFGLVTDLDPLNSSQNEKPKKNREGGGIQKIIYPTGPDREHLKKYHEVKLDALRGKLGETIFDPKNLDYQSMLNRNFRLARRIKGYFQTSIFFDQINTFSNSQSYFGPKISNYSDMKMNINFNKFINDINGGESFEKETVAIHIRRGDFWSNRNTFGVLDLKYYLNALSIVLKYRLIRKIVILSDEYSQANHFARVIQKITDIPSRSIDLSAKETFYYMMNCRNMIISNSSFSWWAAKLGVSELVVVPNPWFRAQSYADTLLPQNWIKSQS